MQETEKAEKEVRASTTHGAGAFQSQDRSLAGFLKCSISRSGLLNPRLLPPLRTKASLSAWGQTSTSECKGQVPANCACRDLNGSLVPSQTSGYPCQGKGLSVWKREWVSSPWGQGGQALTFTSTAEAQNKLDRSLI